MRNKSILFVIISLFMIAIFSNIKFKADTTLEQETIYTTSYEIGGTNSIGIGMIGKYFDSNVEVSNINDIYLVSITLLDNNALTNLKIIPDSIYNGTISANCGIVSTISGKKTSYTVSLSYEDLNSNIHISGLVDAMNMEVSFTIKVNLDNVVKTDKVLDDIEYPAKFIPTIEIESMGDINSSQNAICKIPSAKAYFENEELDVEISVLNPMGGIVDISNNQFVLEELGNYQINYKASTDKYKTSLGNNSFITKTINVISSSIESSIVKFNDINNILPSGYIVSSQRITSGLEYDRISKLLENITENYEITNVKIMDSDAQELSLDNTIEIYIEANPEFNRNEIVIYHVEGDNMTKLEARGYGRYVLTTTSLTGSFVVCVEGIAFHMPMWGYIFIAVGTLVLIALIVILTLILIKRKRKLNKELN